MSLATLRHRPLAVCLLLAAAALGSALLALAVGPLNIPLPRVLGALGLPLPADDIERAALLHIRLPRVVLALLVGAALAQAGAAMQGLFRNPLAEPGLVGVSSGAALAAVAVIVLWHAPPWVLPAATFAGGLAAAWFVARIGSSNGYTRVATMLLAGLALNALAGAGIGFFSFIADDLALRSLMFWMFGSLGKAGWDEIALAAPLLLAALLLIPRDARALDALLLGEAEAGHLGVEVECVKRRLLLLCVLAVATSVSLAGIIGFVGLIVPHLVRLWAGPGHRLLLPASALMGAALLVLADLGARTWLAPAELPIGVLTALVGGPFFLALIVRYRNSAETL
jgi:iron complex transport system permease protein